MKDKSYSLKNIKVISCNNLIYDCKKCKYRKFCCK